MNVLMALTDYIPVALFTVTAVILQRGLYEKMSKGAFALFSAGTIMITVAGFFKATWKLLYALQICDFEKLNLSFFPMQSVGFLLAGTGITAMAFFKQKDSETGLYGVSPLFLTAPAVFSGTFIFVCANVLGTLMICIGLSKEAKKQRKPFAIAMFTLSFVFMLIMGYLSSKDFDKALMNWIAQGINTLGQFTLLMGSLKITRK